MISHISKAVLFVILFTLNLNIGHTASSADSSKTFEDLEQTADTLWLNKSFVQLGTVLDQMLSISQSSENIEQTVESLIQLHEYEAFYHSDNAKALEYIIHAIDMADQYGLGALRLKARSKLLYFHQSTTQDEDLVVEILDEMVQINKAVGSKFYSVVNAQWMAQIVGTKRLVGIPVTEEEVNRSIAILKESINYFNSSDQDHLFYYQQARRCILGFYGDRFGYDTCLRYSDEIKSLAPRMKEPITEVANLVFEGTFLANFKKYKLLVERLKEGRHLLEESNHGLSKFYYQLLTEGYAKTGDFRSAMGAMQKMYEHDNHVNEVAFSNKVESIRLKNESAQLEEKNTELYNRSFFVFALAGLLLLGLVLAILSWMKIKKQSAVIDRQRKNLDETNKAKSKLLGLLAHDLRQPISAFADLGKKINFLAEKKAYDRINALTTQIEETTTGLESVLSNVLEWISSQVAYSDLKKIEVALQAIIDECKSELQHSIANKNIKVESNLEASIRTLVNRESTHIVFRNVLSNAVKFSNEGGVISITGQRNGDKVHVEVKDNGVGISESVLKSLFTEYISTPGTSGEKGTGLGLRMSKDLITANGGAIDVKSKFNEGTTVTLILPAA